MKIEGVWCAGPGCTVNVPDELVARAAGWHKLGEAWYCGIHLARGRSNAREAELRLRQEEQLREVHEKLAKTGLSAAEYRAWDEFQANLARYHKKHGKLAPKQLRLMGPKQFAAIRSQNRDMDYKIIELDVEHMAAAIEQQELNQARIREQFFREETGSPWRPWERY